MEIQDRLWTHLRVHPLGCWEWQAYRDGGGYGRVAYERAMWPTHRLMWVVECGPIPDGLVVDHICFNRSCCNPAHLQLLTQAENVKRSFAAGHYRSRDEKARAQTHCKRGHHFTVENTKINPSTGRRSCRACLRMHARNYYGRKKAA